MSRRFAAILVLASLAGRPSLPAQDVTAVVEREATPVYELKDLVLRYYTPGAAEVRTSELIKALERVHGRFFDIREGKGSTRRVQNLILVGRSIGIFETPDRADLIFGTLPAMEQALRGDAGQAEPQEAPGTTVIPLRYVPAVEMRNALRSFARDVMVPSDGRSAPNLVPEERTNSIIIFDTPRNTEEIKRLVATLDRQVTGQPGRAIIMTAWVLEAAPETAAGRLPAEIGRALEKLLPGRAFQVIGTAITRTSEKGGGVNLSMRVGQDRTASLSAQRLATAEDGGGAALEIGALEFHLTRPRVEGTESLCRLSTATRLAVGEAVVIAAAGESPYVLVLQVTFG